MDRAYKYTMLLEELIRNQPNLPQILEDFLPLAMAELKLTKLPRIRLVKHLLTSAHPSFGRYLNGQAVIELAISNRHPLDIVRTLAHELAHFKQDLDGRINHRSGVTGSPEENEAHQQAGVMMRNFGKKYPQYFNVRPLTFNTANRKFGKQYAKYFKKTPQILQTGNMKYKDISSLIESAAAMQINQDLNAIEQAVEDDPSKEQFVKTKLQILLNWLKSVGKEQSLPAAEKPASEIEPTHMIPKIAATPASQPSIRPTTQLPMQPLGLEKTNENAIVGAAGNLDEIEELIQQLNNSINEICAQVADCAPIVKALKDQVAALKNKVVEKISHAFTKGKTAGVEEYKSLDQYIKTMLERIPGGNNPQAVSSIRSIFEKDNVDPVAAKKFLESAAKGKVIDMQALVKSKNGNIVDFVDKSLEDTFNKVIADFFDIMPAKTGGNIGPGEIAFILLGNPTEKVKKGDLKIGKDKFEIKASSFKKEGGKSGALLGGDKISTGKALWPKIKKILLSYGIKDTEEKEGKKSGPRYRLNGKGLSQFNQSFEKLNLNLNDRAEMLTKILKEMYPSAINKKTKTEVKEILRNHDGRLEENVGGEFMRYVALLALRAYRQDPDKDNFIFFNKTTKNFMVLKGDQFEKELLNPDSKLEVMRGVDWNDGQMKATPGLGIYGK